MRRDLMNLRYFFEPRTIAIIGASRVPTKIGHVIYKNFVNSKFEGKVYPVNPKADRLLGNKAYPSISDIKHEVDLAVISTPANTVPKIVEQCVKKEVKSIIVISGGFGEIGKGDLEDEIRRSLKGTNTRLIGVNCIGVFDPATGVDTMFLPDYRLARPKKGGIAYITQSGAVGSTTLDWATSQGIGISKFISYGNATDVDEADLLEYLAEDPETNVIIAYLEGVKNGRHFYEVAKEVTKKKPIIILKGGMTEGGNKAATSHTGVLAGSAEVYKAAFKQAGIIIAETTEELFTYARVLKKCKLPKGRKVQIITDGGGFGVLAADAVTKNGLELSEMEWENKQLIKRVVPSYAVVKNPIDLVGDADVERYQVALTAAVRDPNVDMILTILLYQVPTLDPEIVEVMTNMAMQTDKPIVTVSAGGLFTEVHMDFLEAHGIPSFDSPTEGVRALAALAKYAEIKKK